MTAKEFIEALINVVFGSPSASRSYLCIRRPVLVMDANGHLAGTVKYVSMEMIDGKSVVVVRVG